MSISLVIKSYKGIHSQLSEQLRSIFKLLQGNMPLDLQRVKIMKFISAATQWVAVALKKLTQWIVTFIIWVPDERNKRNKAELPELVTIERKLWKAVSEYHAISSNANKSLHLHFKLIITLTHSSCFT